MLIDRRSTTWIIICLAMFVVATGLYVPYARNALNGPRGGSVPGLIFAGVGSAMMLFALLLGLRRKLRTMRIGRAYHWLQAHVWLGLLSYPMILYHAGFHGGGTLTQVIMWLFTLVIASGIVGVLLQQFLPSKMMRDVPAETIYEQIGHVLEQLRDEARRIAEASSQPEHAAFELEVIPAGGAATAVSSPQRAVNATAALAAFYREQVEPFLADRLPRSSSLADEASSSSAFASTREALPTQFHAAIADLQSIVDERRQLERQRRLHHLLYGWLLVHVPLAYALVILSAAHAVMALRFTTISPGR